jgi:hypothetical protein
MSSTIHEQERAALQARLDSIRDGVTLRLPSQEYPGPIEIKHPLTLDGKGATFWALRGPVVTVSSPGVTLSGLKIEVTGGAGSTPADTCALYVKPGCGVRLQNVEVRGSVVGVAQEEGEWRFPSSLQLGSLPLGVESDFIVRLYVPVACGISSNISGLDVEPKALKPGPNEVTLHVEQLPADMLLNGVVLIKTANLIRRILVNAHISSTRPKKPSKNSPRSKTSTPIPKVFWQPQDWDMLPATPVVVTPFGQPENDVITLPPPPPPTGQPNGQSDIEVYDPVGSKSPTPTPAPPPPIPSGPEKGKDVKVWPGMNPPLPGGGAGSGPQPGGGSGSGTQSPPTIVQPPPPSPLIQPPPPQPPPVVPSQTTGTSSRRYLFAGIGAVVLILLALGVWKLFLSGPGTVNPETVKRQFTLSHGSAVTAVAFSPDGSTVASGGGDGSLKLWDASTGEAKTQPPRKHTDAVTALAFSHNGNILASASADNNVILWDANQAGQIKSKTPLGERVTSLSFSPDDKLLACGVQDGKVRLIETQNGQQTSVIIDHKSPVRAVAFSSDGKTLASGGDDGTTKLWDVASGGLRQQLTTRHEGPVTALAYSADGKTLASGGADALVYMWDAAAESTKPPPLRHTGAVSSLAFSPDGQVLVSGVGSRSGSVDVWDLTKSLPSPKVLGDHNGAVNAVAVSRSGQIASGSTDQTVMLWK